MTGEIGDGFESSWRLASISKASGSEGCLPRFVLSSELVGFGIEFATEEAEEAAEEAEADFDDAAVEEEENDDEETDEPAVVSTLVLEA